jgi:hypothetical protein
MPGHALKDAGMTKHELISFHKNAVPVTPKVNRLNCRILKGFYVSITLPPLQGTQDFLVAKIQSGKMGDYIL